MSEPTIDQVRWTTADLEQMPADGTRYEIVEGELFMTRARSSPSKSLFRALPRA